MTHETPRRRTPQETPPVRTLADLERHWRFVKGPWGFSGPQLFCQLFDVDGTVLPQIINITDCPDVPDELLVDNLLDIMGEALAEFTDGGSCAVMFARPGDGQLRASDRAWARGLSDATAAALIETWPVFLANDTVVRIVAPDDLAA